MVSIVAASLILLCAAPALIAGQGYEEYLRLWMPSDCYDQGREYQDNETWEVGVVRYQCLNRKRTPVGCQILGRWYNEGESALSRSGSYEMTCQMDSEGYMRVASTKCVYANQRYAPGQIWNSEENKFWFRCEKLDELRVQIIIGGCVTDLGERLDIGERHTVGETWYLCEKKPTDAIAFCTQGCVDNGQYYNIGQTWSGYDGEQYRCDKDNLQCRITRIESLQSRDPQEQTYGYSSAGSSSNTNGGRCEYRQNGVVRFYIPFNSYTYSPYNNELFIICRENDYEAREVYYSTNPDLSGLTYVNTPDYA